MEVSEKDCSWALGSLRPPLRLYEQLVLQVQPAEVVVVAARLV